MCACWSHVKFADNAFSEFYATHTANGDLLAHPFCPVRLSVVARVHNGNAATHVHWLHISSALSLMHASVACWLSCSWHVGDTLLHILYLLKSRFLSFCVSSKFSADWAGHWHLQSILSAGCWCRSQPGSCRGCLIASQAIQLLTLRNHSHCKESLKTSDWSMLCAALLIHALALRTVLFDSASCRTMGAITALTTWWSAPPACSSGDWH